MVEPKCSSASMKDYEMKLKYPNSTYNVEDNIWLFGKMTSNALC